jgi:hypothetical protein
MPPTDGDGNWIAPPDLGSERIVKRRDLSHGVKRQISDEQDICEEGPGTIFDSRSVL